MSVSVLYLESNEIVCDLGCDGRELSHRGLWVMSGVDAWIEFSLMAF